MSERDGGNVDPALLELFHAELDAHIPVLSDGLLALEKGRDAKPEIAAMMRAAHSIKGAARIVGIESAVRVAHLMEDCFTAAKDGRIELASAAVDILLQGVDALQRICSPQSAAGPDQPPLDTLLQQVEAVRDGRMSPKSERGGANPTIDRTTEPIRGLAPRGAKSERDNPTAEAPLAMPDASHRTTALLDSRSAVEQRLLLPADLNDAASERLRVQLSDILRQGVQRICLDFAQVNCVSASALSVLVSLAREAARLAPPPTLTIDGVAGPLAVLTRVTGLDRAWSYGR